MEYVAHEEMYMGRKIKIYHDSDSGAPWEEMDFLGKIMTCGRVARDFRIGHEQRPNSNIDDLLIDLVCVYEEGFKDEIDGLENAISEEIESRMNKYYVWDYIDVRDCGSNGVKIIFGSEKDGAGGVIFATQERAQKWFGSGPNAYDNAIKCLEGEIETCDMYVGGDVYGYVVEDVDGDPIDSCFGFYEETPWEADSRIMSEARSVIEYTERKSLEIFD